MWKKLKWGCVAIWTCFVKLHLTFTQISMSFTFIKLFFYINPLCYVVLQYFMGCVLVWYNVPKKYSFYRKRVNERNGSMKPSAHIHGKSWSGNFLLLLFIFLQIEREELIRLKTVICEKQCIGRERCSTSCEKTRPTTGMSQGFSHTTEMLRMKSLHPRTEQNNEMKSV